MPRSSLTKHRCAVCWEWQTTHNDWFEHATTKHGAVLAEFGYDHCKVENGSYTCPGLDHAARIDREGPPRQKQVRTMPERAVARDGTVYTQGVLPDQVVTAEQTG